jgi:reactive chlorine resistance protein C
MSIQRGSELIGIVELAIGLAIALRHWSPKVCAVGSTGAIGMFLTTLSFLVTTPGLDAGTQGFIMKDVFLLGAAVWSAGEALRSARTQ